MINGFVINGAVINGSGDGLVGASPPLSIIASGIAVEFEDAVITQALGIAVEIEDTVGIIASGIAIEFEDAVVFSATASGIAIEFEDAVITQASGIAIEFEDRVKNAFENATHAQRFGWDAIVTIGGKQVPLCEIGGDITINKVENSAALAKLTLINQTGAQDFTKWHGKSVLIDIETAAGIRRRFTGTIDYAAVDMVNKTIKLDCTDRREERINAELSGQVKFIGFHSPAIYQTPADTAEELRQRLETTPKAVDFDSFGSVRITDLLAKATPDFTLDRCDISIDPPVLNLSPRARLVNKINLQFEARWTRLRHREKSFSIDTPTFCDYMTVQGLDYLRIDTVYRTLESFPWTVKPGSVNFDYLPEAGYYNCGNGKFIWIPPRGIGGIKIVRDQYGDIVYDKNGNPVYEPVSGSSAAPVFCLGASWTAAKDWAQDISENLHIAISAPQSVNQYGEIEKTISYGYEVDYDAADYEGEGSYQTPTGFVSVGSGEFYLDKSGDPADYRRALQTAFAVCETTITKSHRENTVAFKSRNVWAEVETYHTVAINTNTVTCRGKVKQIDEVYGASSKRASTNIILALSRAEGSQAPESISLQLLNAPLIGAAGQSITYQLYKGQALSRYDTPPVKNDNLKTPDIDDMSRNQQKTIQSYSYNTPIQNDPLVVNF